MSSVIAAVAPPGNAGMNFNSYDGTSMSAPHITGIATLILQKHPTWSPMWVKSAMMTGATTLTNMGHPIKRGAVNATPLDYGSGHVVPAKSFDPGLVYDSTKIDWDRYACGIGQLQTLNGGGAACASVGSIDPSDLNYPSIAASGMAGSQTITRTFTNTSPDQASQYKPTIVAPPGTTVTVNDDKITVPPLQSRSYKLTITRTTATLNAWTFGSITWTDKRGHSVRSPIAVRPVAAAVPTTVTGNGTLGHEGRLRAARLHRHAQPASPGSPRLASTRSRARRTSRRARRRSPSRSAPRWRGSRRTTRTTPPGTDIDLEVRRNGVLVGTSGGATAEESVNLNAPVAGDYVVTVVYFDGATPEPGHEAQQLRCPGDGRGNLTATPASQPVTTGVPVTVNLTWTGLDAGCRYLGTVTYSDGHQPPWDGRW